jgi:hypothetical protein
MPFLKQTQARAESGRGDSFYALPGQLRGRDRVQLELTAAETDVFSGHGSGDSIPRPGLFQVCANPGCRSGWIHLLRGRSAPVFESGWTCCSACTRERVAAAVHRELAGRSGSPEVHRHRIPLGLIMLEQGWINADQIRLALEAQRAAGGGRIGHWLMRQAHIEEQLVTRALGLQWSCPVLPLGFHDAEALTVLLPRLFIDAFGALPLRVAAGKLLYLGFEERLDPVLSLAIEQMTGLRTESGIVRGSLFRAAQTRGAVSQRP